LQYQATLQAVLYSHAHSSYKWPLTFKLPWVCWIFISPWHTNILLL